MALNKRAARSQTTAYKAAPSATQMNWDAKSGRSSSTKGTKPLPEPVTIKEVFVMMILHLCKKVLFVNTHLKVGVYIAALFFGSLICDFIPLPRTYFARKTNFLNLYFVKMGWFWTVFLVGAFVLLSSYTYCCGDKIQVRKHISRLAIASVIWYTCTTVFVYIESVTGVCSTKPDELTTKLSCIRQGYRWYGFDISGHAFLLIYSSLIIIEEVKCLRGWERIGDLIRGRDYDTDSPLLCLQEEEMTKLRVAYEYLGGYIKALFIAMTLLSLLWDFMLFCTILYFHSMMQKLVGGLVALLMWFVTYRAWYLNAEMSPGLPGQGPFRYSDVKPYGTRVKNMKSETENASRNDCRNE